MAAMCWTWRVVTLFSKAWGLYFTPVPTMPYYPTPPFMGVWLLPAHYGLWTHNSANDLQLLMTLVTHSRGLETFSLSHHSVRQGCLQRIQPYSGTRWMLGECLMNTGRRANMVKETELGTMKGWLSSTYETKTYTIRMKTIWLELRRWLSD